MWYVIWTDTNKEDQAVERLKRELPDSLCRDYWVPKRVERQKHQQVWISVEKPLFPGYFFIEMDEPEKLRTYIQRIGIFQLPLRTGDTFVPLTEQEERRILCLTDGKKKMGISYGIKENGKFRILRGPLFGLEQYIKKVDLHKRSALLEMEFFGRTQRIRGAIEFADEYE